MSNVGRPAAGTVQEVSAIPMERPWALTLRQRSATVWRSAPLSAAAPQIFSASTVVPHPAPPRRVEAVPHSDIVVDDHRGNLDPVGLAQFGRHLEIEHVAGVVFHDVQNPGAPVDRPGGGLHLIGGGRGEDLPRAGGIQHPPAHEAAVQRLVAAPRPRRTIPTLPCTGASTRTMKWGSK